MQLTRNSLCVCAKQWLEGELNYKCIWAFGEAGDSQLFHRFSNDVSLFDSDFNEILLVIYVLQPLAHLRNIGGVVFLFSQSCKYFDLKKYFFLI